MNELPRNLRTSHRAAAVLFALAGIAYIGALLLPLLIIKMNRRFTADTGWEVFLDMLLIVISDFARTMKDANQYRLTFTPPYLVFTVANLTLLLNAVLGWKLRSRHVVPMLILSVIGLLAALNVPIWLYFIEQSTGWPAYLVPLIGFWLWLAALILVPCGWGALLLSQKRSRLQAMRADVSKAMEEP